MKKIRVAFIGLAHIHFITLSADFMKYPEQIEFVGMADVPPYTQEELETRIRMNVPDDRNVPLWDDYRKLLKQDIDVAIICTDIKDHARIVEETLAMGIHTLVEKPMALDMADAKRMYQAYQQSEAALIINWPVAWMPAFRKVKELVANGEIGDVLRIQYRSPATRGPYKLNEYTPEELSKLWWYQHDRGGGAICDYAGYGCVLTTWIADCVAEKVSGLKKNFFLPFSDVEDYAVFIIDFGKSVGIVEGSWATLNNGQIPTGPIVYGTEGVIVSDRYDSEVKVYKDIKAYEASVTPTAVYQTDAEAYDIAENVIRFLNDEEKLFELVTPEFNMKAMSAFDAGRRSCETTMPEKTENPF